MNSGRGVAMKGFLFFIEVLSVRLVCVAMTLYPLFTKNQSLMFPP